MSALDNMVEAASNGAGTAYGRLYDVRYMDIKKIVKINNVCSGIFQGNNIYSDLVNVVKETTELIIPEDICKKSYDLVSSELLYERSKWIELGPEDIVDEDMRYRNPYIKHTERLLSILRYYHVIGVEYGAKDVSLYIDRLFREHYTDHVEIQNILNFVPAPDLKNDSYSFYKDYNKSKQKIFIDRTIEWANEISDKFGVSAYDKNMLSMRTNWYEIPTLTGTRALTVMTVINQSKNVVYNGVSLEVAPMCCFVTRGHEQILNKGIIVFTNDGVVTIFKDKSIAGLTQSILSKSRTLRYIKFVNILDLDKVKCFNYKESTEPIPSELRMFFEVMESVRSVDKCRKSILLMVDYKGNVVDFGEYLRGYETLELLVNVCTLFGYEMLYYRVGEEMN